MSSKKSLPGGGWGRYRLLKDLDLDRIKTLHRLMMALFVEFVEKYTVDGDDEADLNTREPKCSWQIEVDTLYSLKDYRKLTFLKLEHM